MLNKVCLMGRLTKDPEIRYASESNLPIARFTVAVNRSFKNKNGEYDTDFISCVAFNRTAEFINNYFIKGKAIIVVGRIQTRNWEDQEGKRHYVTEVVAEEVSFGESKGSGNGANKSQNDSNDEQDGGFFPVESDDELPF